MEIIILSGGLGTRLRERVNDVPKVMADVNGKPFLKIILDDINNSNVNRVILATGYKKEYIKKYFNNKYGNINLVYSEENEPLGTGGAIKQALQYSYEDDIIIINGDVYQKINYQEIYNKHKKNNADVTLALKEMKNFDRFGSVIVDDDKITNFEEKKFVEKGLMSVGCYVFNKKKCMKYFESNKFSIENDFFTKYINDLKFSYYLYHDVFVDIGIPCDYDELRKLIK